MRAGWILIACWLGFVVAWAVAAMTRKRTARRAPWWGGPGFRLLAIALIALFLRLRIGRHLDYVLGPLAGQANPAAAWLGIVVCLSGFALALWARVYLGRNWGTPMTLRVGHELVTGGPYAYVRHPIYSGILIAMLGSTLAGGVAWLVGAVVFGAYFLVSARAEEKLMLAQFPIEYPAYMRRTKMLVPFVL